jgi:hypothetical protein
VFRIAESDVEDGKTRRFNDALERARDLCEQTRRLAATARNARKDAEKIRSKAASLQKPVLFSPLADPDWPFKAPGKP